VIGDSWGSTGIGLVEGDGRLGGVEVMIARRATRLFPQPGGPASAPIHGFAFGIAFSMARRANFASDTPPGSPLVRSLSPRSSI
jgi:hypothetical protein